MKNFLLALPLVLLVACTQNQNRENPNGDSEAPDLIVNVENATYGGGTAVNVSQADLQINGKLDFNIIYNNTPQMDVPEKVLIIRNESSTAQTLSFGAITTPYSIKINRCPVSPAQLSAGGSCKIVIRAFARKQDDGTLHGDPDQVLVITPETSPVLNVQLFASDPGGVQGAGHPVESGTWRVTASMEDDLGQPDHLTAVNRREFFTKSAELALGIIRPIKYQQIKVQNISNRTVPANTLIPEFSNPNYSVRTNRCKGALAPGKMCKITFVWNNWRSGSDVESMYIAIREEEAIPVNKIALSNFTGSRMAYVAVQNAGNSLAGGIYGRSFHLDPNNTNALNFIGNSTATGVGLFQLDLTTGLSTLAVDFYNAPEDLFRYISLQPNNSGFSGVNTPLLSGAKTSSLSGFGIKSPSLNKYFYSIDSSTTLHDILKYDYTNASITAIPTYSGVAGAGQISVFQSIDLPDRTILFAYSNNTGNMELFQLMHSTGVMIQISGAIEATPGVGTSYRTYAASQMILSMDNSEIYVVGQDSDGSSRNNVIYKLSNLTAAVPTITELSSASFAVDTGIIIMEMADLGPYLVLLDNANNLSAFDKSTGTSTLLDSTGVSYARGLVKSLDGNGNYVFFVHNNPALAKDVIQYVTLDGSGNPIIQTFIDNFIAGPFGTASNGNVYLAGYTVGLGLIYYANPEIADPSNPGLIKSMAGLYSSAQGIIAMQNHTPGNTWFSFQDAFDLNNGRLLMSSSSTGPAPGGGEQLWLFNPNH